MNKPMKNPRQPSMGRPIKKVKKGTFSRVIKHLFSFYKAPFVIVFICIALSALAGALPALFQQSVLTDVQDALDFISFSAKPFKVKQTSS